MRRRPRKRLKEEDTLEGSNVCRLCREEPNEELYGKFFVEEGSGFSVHQYCMFFSSGLAQSGEDDEGFDGFLIKDIKKEISRAKRLKCSFCKKPGATIGCCDARCHYTFHYKCGRERGSLFQFFGSFNSFCLCHRPTQNVNLSESRNKICPICWCEIEWNSRTSLAEVPLVTPCCKKSWFHNSCLQKHALSSGLYYCRCPVCKDMESFQAEMKRMGIFIPDQDASWERDDAFADLLYQHNRCDAQKCICPFGRTHKETAGKWRIRLCDLCGQFGTHLKCQHWKRSPTEWHCDVCGNTLPYSSTRQRPVGDHSMDPYISDGEQSSSSSDDCEVNVCAVSDDDTPLAVLKRNSEEPTQLSRSAQEYMEEGACAMPRLQTRSSAERVRERASPMRKRPQEQLHLRSSAKEHMGEGASPKRKRRRLSLQSSPSKAEGGATSSINDLLDSSSMTSSVLFVISDAVFGGAAPIEEMPDAAGVTGTVNDKKESEAILIRDTDSECSSDVSVEVLKIGTEADEEKAGDAISKSIEAVTVDAVNVNSPRTRKRNLAKLKGSSLVEHVAKVEADSSATILPVKVESFEPQSVVNLLNFESKHEPYSSDDDSCLITKVVKKPCPVGNDKVGECSLRCCNPVSYFCPNFGTTGSKGTSCKCKDLQITTISSTSSCNHVQGKSVKQEQSLPSAKTTALTEDHPSKTLCTVGTNTLPLKPSARKEISYKQRTITETYFPKGKRPSSPSGQHKRLNLRSKKNGSYLERSLRRFYSLREDHMAVNHRCFR